MTNTRPALLLALMLLPLAGCGLFTSKATRALRASPDYKAGYADGCSSAGGPGANPREDSQVRDDQAFATNRAYRAGWRSGFGACRPFTAPQGGAPGAGPIPDVSPGQH